MLYSLPCTYAVGAAASHKKTLKVAAALAPTGAPTQPLHHASTSQAQLDAPTNSLCVPLPPLVVPVARC